MAKDYYLILGVPLDAAPGQIRSAFRKLAMKYHPDRHTGGNARAFRDVAEAYGVLSDPARRARYDRLVCRPAVASSRSVPSYRHDIEPLVSDRIPVTGEPELAQPSFESLFDRLSLNFVDVAAPKSDHAEPLNFELILSDEEAERGVLVPFEVPVFRACYTCAGLGRNGMDSCGDCDGEGRLVDTEIAEVRVPGGVRDGAVIEISLERLGVHNLWLCVHVRVENH
jgi:DnaJ-class molecular chaperone